MNHNPTTAALGRAILKLEDEAGKMHLEASLARSTGYNEHAKFFAINASKVRRDAEMISELMGSRHNPQAFSLIVHDPSDLPKCTGEILVALWGANEWEIVNVRENINGPFTAVYKNTGYLADPSEWQWWADLHCMIPHNADARPLNRD